MCTQSKKHKLSVAVSEEVMFVHWTTVVSRRLGSDAEAMFLVGDFLDV